MAAVIDEYLREFERWTVATPEERRDWTTELATHLAEADEAGELDGALTRLGSPRDAAAAFSGGRRFNAAPMRSRWRAAAIDYAPLFLLSVALAVWEIVGREPGNSFGFVFPPLGVVVDSQRPVMENVIRNVAVLVVGLWSFLGLALIESRRGRTPGKRLLGLATISEDGTAVSLKQALIRRIPVWIWWLFWADLIALATARRQRVFEMLAGTRVIEDPSRSAAGARA